MLTRIAPVLGVDDVDAAVEYYCGTLGFDCPYGSIGAAGEEQPVYSILGRAGTELHLQIRRREIWPPDGRDVVGRSAYFIVNDVERLQDEFVTSGANIIQQATRMPYGLREMVVEDKDGHRISFGQDPDYQSENWEVAPVLGVRDVVEGVDWFRDVLGFDCPSGVYSVGEGEAPVYAILSRDQISIHLQIRRRTIFDNARDSFEGDTYLKFDYIPNDVERVDALHQELADRGAVIHRGLLNEEYGFRDFTVLTPMGHRLTFGMPLFKE